MSDRLTFSVFFFFLLLIVRLGIFFFFFFNDPATTEIYTLSLHDALPIWTRTRLRDLSLGRCTDCPLTSPRSEEHTSELQSRVDLVCRLLLEKKKKKKNTQTHKKNTQIINHNDTIQHETHTYRKSEDKIP